MRSNPISPVIKYHSKNVVQNRHRHIQAASPTIRYPCFMGINTPTTTKKKCTATKPELEHLAEYLGANCAYLSGGLVSTAQEGIIFKKQNVKKQDTMIQENGTGPEPCEKSSRGMCSLSQSRCPADRTGGRQGRQPCFEMSVGQQGIVVTPCPLPSLGWCHVKCLTLVSSFTNFSENGTNVLFSLTILDKYFGITEELGRSFQFYLVV